MGSWMGLPEEDKWTEREGESLRVLKRSRTSFGACLCFLFTMEKINLLSSVPWVGSVHEAGHTATHARSCTHKHNNACTVTAKIHNHIGDSVQTFWCSGDSVLMTAGRLLTALLRGTLAHTRFCSLQTANYRNGSDLLNLSRVMSNQ